MPPKISVVIPTYNNAALLCETLDGVRRQTFKDFEIIVVDDGSKDNTGDVVARYDPTIHYLQQSNQGPAAARNKGVSLAQGEFIAFCDHDDIWNERHLEKLLGCFPIMQRRPRHRHFSPAAVRAAASRTASTIC